MFLNSKADIKTVPGEDRRRASLTMPLLSIKGLAVAINIRAGPAEDDPPLYK